MEGEGDRGRARKHGTEQRSYRKEGKAERRKEAQQHHTKRDSMARKGTYYRNRPEQAAL